MASPVRTARAYRHLRRSLILNASDGKLALKYLKSPTQSGIFKLDTVKPQYADLKAAISGLTAKEEKYRLPRHDLASRMLDDGFVSLYMFFTYLIVVKNQDDKDGEAIRHSFYNFEYVLGEVDLVPLFDKYKDAIDYFEKNIYVHGKDDEFRASETIIKIKNGFIVSNTHEREAFDLVSLSRPALENIGVFLRTVGIVSEDVRIYSLFSPEEELLEPYVDILAVCLDGLPVSTANQRHFTKAISNYYDEDYTGSVSSAGLVAEEYLSQIYETLAREPVPRNLTLGQLSKKIGTTSRDIESPIVMGKRLTQAEIMRDIEKVRYSTDDKYVKKVAKNILRYIAYTTKEVRADLRIVDKSDQSYAIFPRLIKMGLDDLIIYRNAASHKSMESIDSLKALKSLSSSLSVAIWWEATRKTIDASDTKEGVYNHLVSEAKVYE